MNVPVFDPRAIGDEVYTTLTELRQPYDRGWKEAKSDKEKKLYRDRLKEQKNQAVELYTYLSTWGLMRLKAEEMALDKSKPGDRPLTLKQKAEKSQEGKREMIIGFFKCLATLSELQQLDTPQGLQVLKQTNLSTDAYLGLTGLGLAIAREFSFWATAVYHDISGDD